MSPEQVDALVREITESAALAAEEFGEEPSGGSTAFVVTVSAEDEAVLAFERAMGRAPALPPASAAHAASVAEPDDDEWFSLNRGRTARLRHARPEDRRPHWLSDGQAAMASVRKMNPHERPSLALYAASSFSEGVDDSDEAVLAATRAAAKKRF